MVANALRVGWYENDYENYDLNALYVFSSQIRTGVLIDDYKYKRIGDQRVLTARRRAMTRARASIV